MTLWTIQPVAFWKKLKRERVLRGDGRRGWRYFRPAYGWMKAQMLSRNLLRPGQHPIWVWQQPKPDLRHGALLTRGIRGVRLELNVPSSDVLLSDFQAWHCVLNQGYLALNGREEDRFETLRQRRAGKQNPRWNELPADIRAAVRKSWERIFDLKTLRASPCWKTRRGIDDIQGTMAEVRLSDVRRVDYFTSR